VTTPATNKTSEDQRCQNRQTEKDEARVHKSILQRVHRFRWLDRRHGSARESPLDNVRDHEQVQKDQRSRAPPTGLRFTDAAFTVASDLDRGPALARNRSSCF